MAVNYALLTILSRRPRLILEFCPRIYTTGLQKSCKPSVRHLHARSCKQDTTVCGFLLQNISPATVRHKGKYPFPLKLARLYSHTYGLFTDDVGWETTNYKLRYMKKKKAVLAW